MDSKDIEQLLMVNGSKLPIESISILRDKLQNCDDYTMAAFAFSQLKDPTISLVLSICIGGYGVDRFYIGDVGLGVGKLVTCGGCGIWWLIDIFLIMDATRKKNFQTLMMQLR